MTTSVQWAATTMCLRTAETIRWPIATATTGSLEGVAATRSEAASASTGSTLICQQVGLSWEPIARVRISHKILYLRARASQLLPKQKVLTYLIAPTTWSTVLG